MSLIKPTTGRVVLFWPSAIAYSEGEQPKSASVAYVHSDRLVNLGGFDHNVQPFAATSVTLLQEDDAPPEHGPFAMWMPYQLGQAAKTDDTGARIADVSSRIADVDMRVNALEGAVNGRSTSTTAEATTA